MTINYLLRLVRAYESVKILRKSNYGKSQPRRREITEEIFNSIVERRPCKMVEANNIGKHYLKAFPIREALEAYDWFDLALALNHHYLDQLGCPVAHASQVDLTENQVHAIAKALTRDFDPQAEPMCQIARTSGRMGEFVRYVGKPHIFYTFIEGKRPLQNSELGLGDYRNSEHAKELEALQVANPDKPSKALTPSHSEPTMMDRVVERLQQASILPAAATAASSTPDPSEAAAIEQEEEIIEQYETIDDFDYGMEFEDDPSVIGDEDVEVMDIDVGEDEDWENDVFQ